MKATDRRRFLAGMGVSGLAAATIGGIVVHAGGQEATIRSVLARLLGPFSMDEANFGRFVSDFTAAYRSLGSAEADLLHFLEVLGPAREVVAISPELASRLQRFDRQLLTEFALGTGLTGAPAGAKLEYGGRFADNPCTNPFARYG